MTVPKIFLPNVVFCLNYHRWLGVVVMEEDDEEYDIPADIIAYNHHNSKGIKNSKETF